MNMYAFEKGAVIEEYIGKGESTQFDFDSSGATLTVFFNAPTSKEIEQFESSRPFEIRYAEIRGILMMLVKIGSLNWMDCPYSIHLSRGTLDFSEDIPEGTGYSLMLMLVDGITGKVRHIRLIGLGTKFSRGLRKKILGQIDNPFDQAAYNMALRNIYSAYSTKDILKLSSEYYRG